MPKIYCWKLSIVFYHRDMDGCNFDIKNPIKYPENIVKHCENTQYKDLDNSPHDYLLENLFPLSLIKELNMSYKDLYFQFKTCMEEELLILLDTILTRRTHLILLKRKESCTYKIIK